MSEIGSFLLTVAQVCGLLSALARPRRACAALVVPPVSAGAGSAPNRDRTASSWPDELVLTGPEAISDDDAAAILTDTGRRPVVHRSLRADEFARVLADTGMDRDFAAFLADLDVAISRGADDRVTTTVEDLTGHPPHGFREVVASVLR